VQDAKLIVVESCGSRPEAELVKGALEESGIPAIIQGDTAGGMREHLAWSGAGFKILVREDDATVARDFLASLAAGDEDLDANSETDGE
jgi:F420-dependent methylenetetrahydromethanopterin dehydrogenase